MKKSMTMMTGLMGLMLLAGCQNMSTIKHGKLKDVHNPVGMKLQVENLGKNARKEPPKRIGTHTFTVFAIPVGAIHSDNPVPETIHNYVSEALVQAGYQVSDVRNTQSETGPVLKGEVKKFWFAGYSWFWPLFIQGGEIKYHMMLQEPDGRIVWEKNIKGDASSVSFIADNGYDKLIKKSMTKLLNKVVKEVQSDEFQNALTTQ